MTITALDIRDQLKERWGLEFSRICRLINGLNSEAYISSDALVSETALSHRAVGQILQRLETFLQQNDEGLRISPQHRAEISRLFPRDDAPPDPWEERAWEGHLHRADARECPRPGTREAEEAARTKGLQAC